MDISFDRFTVLDGATGINLQRAGLAAGVCPEKWITENPDALISLQRRYADAGSDAVYAPTFGANRVKLKKYGLSEELERLNRELVGISRAAVGDRAAVGGDISSPGLFLKPFGQIGFEELVDIFRQQAEVLEAAGVDFFAAETLMTLAEARAAVIAVKSVSDKPVIVTMSFEQNGRSLSGCTPLSALLSVQNLGADAFGINCSVGPEAVLEMLKPLKDFARIPLAAKPNAGLPQTGADGTPVYGMTPEEFAAHTGEFAELGVRLFGGCCGTDERHIAALSRELSGLRAESKALPEANLLCDEKHVWNAEPGRSAVEIELGDFFADDIAEAEADDGTLFVVKVPKEYDAEVFSENQYLLNGPVKFVPEKGADIDGLIRCYNGVAEV